MLSNATDFPPFLPILISSFSISPLRSLLHLSVAQLCSSSQFASRCRSVLLDFTVGGVYCVRNWNAACRWSCRSSFFAGWFHRREVAARSVELMAPLKFVLLLSLIFLFVLLFPLPPPLAYYNFVLSDSDFATNHAGALDTSAQASVSVAIILLGLCVFNLGHFIHLISHPVISGFTSGAAMSIGLSQLKNAFGFIVSTVPQQGQVGYEHNYLVMDWFAKNFNAVFPVVPSTSKDFAKIGMSYTNPYAIKICFGLFIPLVIIMYIKSSIKSTPARKRSWIFRFATLFTSLL